jgi:hypothetical protein
MDAMSIVTAVAYCVTATTTTVTGWLADRFVAAGSSPTRVRKACTGFGLAFASAVIGVGFIHSSVGAMVLLMFSCVAYGVFASNRWAIAQTLAGPSVAESCPACKTALRTWQV